MKKSTKQINQTIKDIYSKKSTKGIDTSTLKLLKNRGLVTDDGKLTIIGENHIIAKMPLPEQCKELGIELIEINLPYNGRPEKALLNYFEAKGFIGSRLEGIAIFTVLKALMLNKLAEHNFLKSRQDACSRYLEAQFTILQDKVSEVISSICNTNKSTFINNIQEIISNPFIKSEYPELSVEFAEAIFDAIETETFVKISKQIIKDPYTYRNGWPDLTLVKEQEVMFIEVKTTDKLHENQLITIPIFCKIIPSKFCVYRIHNMP